MEWVWNVMILTRFQLLLLTKNITAIHIIANYFVEFKDQKKVVKVSCTLPTKRSNNQETREAPIRLRIHLKSSVFLIGQHPTITWKKKTSFFLLQKYERYKANWSSLHSYQTETFGSQWEMPKALISYWESKLMTTRGLSENYHSMPLPFPWKLFTLRQKRFN